MFLGLLCVLAVAAGSALRLGESVPAASGDSTPQGPTYQSTTSAPQQAEAQNPQPPYGSQSFYGDQASSGNLPSYGAPDQPRDQS